ncbi:MAG: hypothetical protein GEV09_06305 [Pseudonocardiaceae bacterium]|nr:hypothetical protein [Pseudonocardiaceae bacterium]
MSAATAVRAVPTAPVTGAVLVFAWLAHLAAGWQEWIVMPLLAGTHLAVAAGLGLLLTGMVTGEPGRRPLRLGVALAVTSALIWVWTRTVGVPSLLVFRPVEVTVTGLIATIADLVVAGVLWLRLRYSPAPAATGPRLPRWVRPTAGTVLAVLGAGLLTNVFFVPIDVLIADPSLAPSPVREVALVFLLLGAVTLLPPRRGRPPR